ncbi:M14 family metallopeptidase [Pseudonocardia thermophila]|uniref:M14 family metallopeptidase n=1 Tax=Pseudonocardia thermophila TaxID=1848 RepID=UPI00248F3CC3|nr:M14 family metallocarboxypeptidase [Pseudonocardia thermophila]
MAAPYPIGTPGRPWTADDVVQWRSVQKPVRSYTDDVLSVVEELRGPYEVIRYGRVGDHPLVALRSRDWRIDLPCALVTGGVHGYETSGVLGALRFAGECAGTPGVNLLVAPCVSPWAYERVQRWNADAVDPNRSFRTTRPAPEAAALTALVDGLDARVLVHVDLHETTDSDEQEFRPALAARDGVEFVPGHIPDGFYLVADAANPQLEFQQAVLDAVADVTHIAPADAAGKIIGSPVVAPGVIAYAFSQLGLCAGVTGAPFTTTTEVYPDSPRTSPQECTRAQVTAARAAISFALAHA